MGNTAHTNYKCSIKKRCLWHATNVITRFYIFPSPHRQQSRHGNHFFGTIFDTIANNEHCYIKVHAVVACDRRCVQRLYLSTRSIVAIIIGIGQNGYTKPNGQTIFEVNACTLPWQCKTSSQRNNLKVHHPGRIPSMNKSSCSWSHTSDLVLVVLAQMSTRWVLLILFLVLTCTARYRWISSVVWILMICWESFGKWKSFQSIVNGHPKRYSANTY